MNMGVFERTEEKFLLTPAQYEMLMRECKGFLYEDEYGWQDICNIYFDNDLNSIILRSLEKPEYKEKMRLRSYGRPGDDNRVYLELKKKYKGVVYKRRIETEYARARRVLSGDREFLKDSQVGREIEFFIRYHNLYPKIFIAYKRLALYSKEDEFLRITFDTDIIYRYDALELDKPISGKPFFETPMYIMEIKSRKAIPLWLTSLLSKNRIFDISFSKYGKIHQKESVGAKSAV